MSPRFHLRDPSRWAVLRGRLEGLECDLTVCDTEGATGPRILLHRAPDPTADDEVGWLLESPDTTLVELVPGHRTRRECIASAWKLALAAGLAPVRLAPGEASVLARLRQVEGQDRAPEDAAASLAIFLGRMRESHAISPDGLADLVQHVWPDRTHPFDILNELQPDRRRSLLEAARDRAELVHMPAPIRRDLGTGAGLDERSVSLSITGELARIRLCRPQVLNALDPEMLDELTDAWDQAEASPGVETIALEAAGPAFMAGVDLDRILGWMEAGSFREIRSFVERGQRFLERVDASPCHTVAWINGLALGAGAEFCAAFDTVLASDRASVGFPELAIDIYPAMGGTQRLPRRIGYHRARAWIRSASLLPAPRALEVGFVDRILDPGAWPSALRTLERRGRRAAGQDRAADGPTADAVASRRWLREGSVALDLAEELLDLSRRVPLRDGTDAELDGLERVYRTAAALAGIRRALGQRPGLVLPARSARLPASPLPEDRA